VWANLRDYSFVPASITGERHTPRVGQGWPLNIEDNQILDLRWAYILMNVGLGAAVLLSVAMICEWFIRRRGPKP
jgi:hypothetical protein